MCHPLRRWSLAILEKPKVRAQRAMGTTLQDDAVKQKEGSVRTWQAIWLLIFIPRQGNSSPIQKDHEFPQFSGSLLTNMASHCDLGSPVSQRKNLNSSGQPPSPYPASQLGPLKLSAKFYNPKCQDIWTSFPLGSWYHQRLSHQMTPWKWNLPPCLPTYHKNLGILCNQLIC